MSEQTPSQTIGPFFGYALPYERGGEVVDRSLPAAIRLHGRVYDGCGIAVPDALLELWQPDESGVISRGLGSRERDGYTFTGFGRTETSRTGDYSFTTVKPGAVSGGAAYALVTIFARGMLQHLFTRVYFLSPDEVPAAVAGDALLSGLQAERVPTLLAVEDGAGSYRFDIRLQGEGETVFLDFDA